MTELEEQLKTEAKEAEAPAEEAAKAEAAAETETAGAGSSAEAKAPSGDPDPYVGVQEEYVGPWMEPIEEAEKYVYQKGDFWAFLIAALRVFLPILLLFFGGIMLVYWFFAR